MTSLPPSREELKERLRAAKRRARGEAAPAPQERLFRAMGDDPKLWALAHAALRTAHGGGETEPVGKPVEEEEEEEEEEEAPPPPVGPGKKKIVAHWEKQTLIPQPHESVTEKKNEL